jgi:hypothetical protein
MSHSSPSLLSQSGWLECLYRLSMQYRWSVREDKTNDPASAPQESRGIDSDRSLYLSFFIDSNVSRSETIIAIVGKSSRKCIVNQYKESRLLGKRGLELAGVVSAPDVTESHRFMTAFSTQNLVLSSFLLLENVYIRTDQGLCFAAIFVEFDDVVDLRQALINCRPEPDASKFL